MPREWSRKDEKRLAGFVNSEEAGRLLAISENRLDIIGESGGHRKLLEAIYNKLLENKVNYDVESYSSSNVKQDIRTPFEILEAPKRGTCLDLSVLFCSLCIANELLPILIIVNGHAFVMVSLKNGLRDWNHIGRKEKIWFKNDVVKDKSELYKLIEEENYVAVECTGFASSQSLNGGKPEGVKRDSAGFLSFERAVEAGREQFNTEGREFEYAIDIATAHYNWEIPIVPMEAGTSLNPFRLLEPYTIADSDRFFGRKDEIEKIATEINENDVIFIHGESGIGKTSLLSAGVTPRLINEGKIVEQISADFEKEFIFADKPNENGSAEKKTIYILDEFEHLFEDLAQKENKDKFIEQLSNLQDSSDTKLIIATREIEETKEVLKDLISGKQWSDFELGLLSEEDAKNVIIESLNSVNFNKDILNYNEEDIEEFLLPELKSLNSGSKEFIKSEGIYPPLLQIVSHELFEIKVKDKVTRFDRELFNNKRYKGARNIIKVHTEEQLDRLFPTDITDAIHVLSSFYPSENKKWLQFKDLLIGEEEKLVEVEKIVEELVKANFLLKKSVDEKTQYAFSSPAVEIMTGMIASEDLKHRSLARIEMHSAWESWMIDKTFASQTQLKTIISQSKFLKLDPISLLFLLRSAVEHKMPARNLLDTFAEDEQSKKFVNNLKTKPSFLRGTRFTDTSRLLNTSIEIDVDAKKESKLPLISKNAVTNSLPQARQTSALLLTISNNNEQMSKAERRVSEAFEEINRESRIEKISDFRKILLLSELKGVISENYPKEADEINNDELDFITHTVMKFWLATRQMWRNSSSIIRATVYGAVLFGLVHGLQRALISALPLIMNYISTSVAKALEFYPTLKAVIDPEKLVIFPHPETIWGNWFIISSFHGVLSCGAFVFGLVCSGCFLKSARERPLSKLYTTASMNWKECLFVSVCGGLTYFAMETIWRLLNLSGEMLPRDQILLFLATGLSGALGYITYYKLKELLGNYSLIIGAYVVALAFGIFQYLFSKHIDTKLTQVLPPKGYKINFVDFEEMLNIYLSGDWAYYFSAFDAFILGLILFFSIAISVRFSNISIDKILSGLYGFVIKPFNSLKSRFSGDSTLHQQE